MLLLNLLSLSPICPGHNMDNAEHDAMQDDMDDASSVAAAPSQDVHQQAPADFIPQNIIKCRRYGQPSGGV